MVIKIEHVDEWVGVEDDELVEIGGVAIRDFFVNDTDEPLWSRAAPLLRCVTSHSKKRVGVQTAVW